MKHAAPAPGSTSPSLNLGLQLRGAQLVAEIENTGQDTLQVFTRACASGCAAYRLVLNLADGSRQPLRERQRVWTRQGPVVARLRPGEGLHEVFEASAPGWDLAALPAAARATLADPKATVSVHLELDMAGDTTQGVPELHAVSNTVLSPPPHRWLLGG